MRPTLPLALLRADDQPKPSHPVATTRAIVDSGADRTTLPARWTPLLGIDLLDDCIEEEPLTAGAPATHYVYGGGLWVELLGHEVLIPVVNFSPTRMCVLGRDDFFDRYLVMVDQRGRRFFLESNPEREEDDPDDDQLDVALAG